MSSKAYSGIICNIPWHVYQLIFDPKGPHVSDIGEVGQRKTSVTFRGKLSNQGGVIATSPSEQSTPRGKSLDSFESAHISTNIG
jgi:hypothetical protein